MFIFIQNPVRDLKCEWTIEYFNAIHLKLSMINICGRIDALGLKFNSKFSSECDHDEIRDTRLFLKMFLRSEIAIWSHFWRYSIDFANPNDKKNMIMIWKPIKFGYKRKFRHLNSSECKYKSIIESFQGNFALGFFALYRYILKNFFRPYMNTEYGIRDWSLFRNFILFTETISKKGNIVYRHQSPLL